MTLPVVIQPDVEAWVWANICDLPGVTSYSYAATQQDRAGWVMATFMQIDARGKPKSEASATAERVRQRMTALPGVGWADGVICYMQPVEGPFFLPDPDGSPRYVTRFEVRVHPPRGTSADP